MHGQLGIPVAYGGILSMLITSGTILSSLGSDRLVRKLGTGKVTAISVGLTAAALFGFSISNSFWMLCLWTLPYGLGAGSVDAVLNNFVALHYKAKHMSWLHCFWGVGATLGPFIMGACLTRQLGWNQGYRVISLLQLVLTAVLVCSLPLWRQKDGEAIEAQSASPPQKSRDLFSLRGAKPILLAFFCYCSLESVTGLWGSSYMVMEKGITAEKAATFTSLFYLGITIGRFLSGFLTVRLSGTAMVRLGAFLAGVGVVLLFVSQGEVVMCGGFIFIGLGCAPIYPSLIHQTPQRFGKEASQAMMGLQMACAYVGSTLAPPVVGVLIQKISMTLFPVLLLVFVVGMAVLFELAPARRREE